MPLPDFLKRSFTESFWKRASVLVSILILVAVAFVIGFHSGAQSSFSPNAIAPGVINKNVGTPEGVDFSLFWKAWGILDQKFVPTENQATDTDQTKLYGAIKGLADSYGDPYTTFFPPQDNANFQAQVSGNFGGVGIEVGMTDGVLVVVAPLKGSPADLAGVKKGDEILKIGTTSTENISVDQAVNLIRGTVGTKVTLTIIGLTDKAPHTVILTRQVINIPTINTIARKDGVFVIQLYTFTADSANLFRNALLQFVQSGDTRLIVDLRGNPGGYLDDAVDMASWFLPSKDIVVQEDDGSGHKDITYSKGYDVFNNSLKMAILVDGGSASASEIFAGALEQNGAAILVGQQTFGKGSVQELVPLTSDTSLKVTIARWLTPNGTSISEHGLTPDYLASSTTQEDAQNGIDPQMDKAAGLLLAN